MLDIERVRVNHIAMRPGTERWVGAKVASTPDRVVQLASAQRHLRPRCADRQAEVFGWQVDDQPVHEIPRAHVHDCKRDRSRLSGDCAHTQGEGPIETVAETAGVLVEQRLSTQQSLQLDSERLHDSPLS